MVRVTLRTFVVACMLLLCANRAMAANLPGDSGWPRTHTKDGASITVYQPQVDEWTDQKSIKFRCAIGVTAAGAKEPTYGVIAARADTIVDREARTVYLANVVADVRFPGLDDTKSQSLRGLVNEMLGSQGVITVSLDRVLACMKPAAMASKGVQLNLDPPPIYYSETPAILVVFHGPPIFKPVVGANGLNFAVNTNWALFQDTASSLYFLLNGDSWLSAPDPVKGPWSAASAPASFSSLPSDANWEDVKKHVPGTPAASVPKVIGTTTPAELIVTNGRAQAAGIAGTQLEYVVNPVQPLFWDKKGSSYYYLVAGRWFKTPNLVGGGWSAASAELPDDFAKIPADSKIGYVLASVPGTQEASDAILLASIPHQATINIAQAKVDVAYEGQPKFVPITGTSMQYAVNTTNQVISADGKYYCCYQGVWFMSDAPTGPWAVCTSVPPVIYTIPPASPVYNVTYVQVYGSTPTTVNVGYTSGYSGEYVAATGVLMFGAGMAMGAAMADNSYYYAYPAPYYAYGCGAYYHYGYGGYYCGGGAYYGPYGGATYSAAYNPATGTYSRAASAYGPYGSASVHQAYNPYTGNAASHTSATNGYESWGHSTATTGSGQWATGGHYTNSAGGTSAWAQTSTGKGGSAYQTAGGATVAKTNSGDVYAGKDGNVYQKSDSGWQQHTSSGWQNANEDSQRQMNSEAQSRSRGNYSSEQFNSFRGGGGDYGGDRWGGGQRSFGGGGFGGGGGGFRGGGRR